MSLFPSGLCVLIFRSWLPFRWKGDTANVPHLVLRSLPISIFQPFEPFALSIAFLDVCIFSLLLIPVHSRGFSLSVSPAPSFLSLSHTQPYQTVQPTGSAHAHVASLFLVTTELHPHCVRPLVRYILTRPPTPAAPATGRPHPSPTLPRARARARNFRQRRAHGTPRKAATSRAAQSRRRKTSRSGNGPCIYRSTFSPSLPAICVCWLVLLCGCSWGNCRRTNVCARWSGCAGTVRSIRCLAWTATAVPILLPMITTGRARERRGSQSAIIWTRVTSLPGRRTVTPLSVCSLTISILHVQHRHRARVRRLATGLSLL
ncbi:hypothetical protein BKA62DRAFT_63720 [Auriculariales sp. MPI-PUGE-AT-0066]|nr:hypothetical protein BKA62DRAFT_63720 [Auriculariales sp. MPI-PUGE-AT-0066]